MIGNIVKAAASIAGAERKTIAAALGISPQALSNKYQRDSFSATDLVKIAEAINGKLILKVSEQEIVFTADDVAEKAQEEK